MTESSPVRFDTLTEWLAYCERLHPRNIALGLDRVEAVRRELGLAFDCPVFTVAGTNGKGSTCAMLESILVAAGYRVGTYTSPHLVHFEERCRVAGEPVSEAALLPHFERVEAARRRAGGVQLTYFEFTTLAMLELLAESRLDAAVLEIGMGGRLDAVNVVDPSCSIICSIDLDHTEFLGPDRESIGREKAGIMRAATPAVVSDPMPPASVVAHAAEIGADLRLIGRDFTYSGDRQQWNWAGRSRRYNGLAYPALRGANQLLNASGVLAALEALHARLPVTAQAVREGFARVTLPGRFQIVPGEPTLVLDVAHNPHAVAALAENLDQMGYYPCTRAVYGAMHDKDIRHIFARIAPLVDAWYFTDLPTSRAMSAASLDALWRSQADARADVPTTRHPDPRSALAAAMVDAAPTDRILVFGSFFTVGGVLAGGLPKPPARHLRA